MVINLWFFFRFITQTLWLTDTINPIAVDALWFTQSSSCESQQMVLSLLIANWNSFFFTRRETKTPLLLSIFFISVMCITAVHSLVKNNLHSRLPIKHIVFVFCSRFYRLFTFLNWHMVRFSFFFVCVHEN